MTRKAPVLLHPEQESSQKKAWERIEGEKAADYMRFRTYLQMGIRRTLQAVAEQEQRPRKAKKGTQSDDAQEETLTENKTTKKVCISGALKRAAVQWRWRERAAAWDEFARLETHKEVLAHLDHESEYVTRAQRLDVLDVLMKNLMHINLGMKDDTIMDDNAYKRWLAFHRQMLATIREIRREMAAVEKLGASSFSELNERLF